MHFVGLGLQVLKKPIDTEPVLVPFAIPVGRAMDDPVLLFRRELVVRSVSWNTSRLGVTHQIILALLPGWSLHGLDGTCPQRQLVVRDHQPVIHANHASKAPTCFAGTNRGIERKHRGDGVGVPQITFRAVQSS